MEKAQKEISDLRGKLKEYETKIIEMQSASISKIEFNNQNNLSNMMLIDSSSDKLNLSMSSNSNSIFG
jgi:hypothetical protein